MHPHCCYYLHDTYSAATRPSSLGTKSYLLFLQVLLKPLHGLQERRLLGVPCHRVADVGPYREPVLHAAKQVDLVGLAGLRQDLFRLVALGGWEDGVGFWVVVSAICFPFPILVKEGEGEIYQQQRCSAGP